MSDLADRKVGEEKMMIHDHDVGFHRLLAHERQEASVVVLALRSETPVAPRVQPATTVRSRRRSFPVRRGRRFRFARDQSSID